MVHPKSTLIGLAVLSLAAAFILAGCGKSYTFPKDQLPTKIEAICKDSFDLDVDVQINGKTIGMVSYVPELVDEAGQFDQAGMMEKIQNLIQTLTRAALSTDFDPEFIVVAFRGIKDQNEIRFIENVADIKRADSAMISRDEASYRTLWIQNKYTYTPESSDFGLEDVEMEYFLTQQVLQRVRFASAASQDVSAEVSGMPSELIDGQYVQTPEEKQFKFAIISFEAATPQENLMKVFRVFNDVIGGYKFMGYDSVVIKDVLNHKQLEISRETMAKFQNKTLKEEDLLRMGFKDDIAPQTTLRGQEVLNSYSF